MGETLRELQQACCSSLTIYVHWTYIATHRLVRSGFSRLAIQLGIPTEKCRDTASYGRPFRILLAGKFLIVNLDCYKDCSCLPWKTGHGRQGLGSSPQKWSGRPYCFDPLVQDCYRIIRSSVLVENWIYSCDLILDFHFEIFGNTNFWRAIMVRLWRTNMARTDARSCVSTPRAMPPSRHATPRARPFLHPAMPTPRTRRAIFHLAMRPLTPCHFLPAYPFLFMLHISLPTSET